MTFLSFLAVQYAVVIAQVTICFVTEKNIVKLGALLNPYFFVPSNIFFVLGSWICYKVWFGFLGLELLYFALIPIGVGVALVFRFLWESAEASAQS
jgi:hypothetical protein